jgi:hypothetical protein
LSSLGKRGFFSNLLAAGGLGTALDLDTVKSLPVKWAGLILPEIETV